MATRQTRDVRSLVLGILMIVAGATAVIVGVVGVMPRPQWGPRRNLLHLLPPRAHFGVGQIFAIIAIVIGALQIAAGIALVRRARHAVRLVYAYASTQLGVGVVLGALQLLVRGPYDRDLAEIIARLAIAVVWPTAILILLPRRASRSTAQR